MADEKGRMREKADKCFDDADCDGSGQLTLKELFLIIRVLGFDKDTDEVKGWFDDLDKNDDDKITKEEFIGEVVDKRSRKDVQEAELRCVFEEMDPDGNGTVSEDELRLYINEKLKYDIEEDKLDGMIKKSDTSGDGNISYKEFLASWQDEM